MKKNETQLRFVVKNDNHEDVYFMISGYPSVIENMRTAIVDFSLRRKDLKVNQTSITNFELNPKSYMAIQHIILEKMA